MNDQILAKLYKQKDNLSWMRRDKKKRVQVHKNIRKRLNKLRNDFYASEARKINQFAKNREIDKIFARSGKHETTQSQPQTTCIDPNKIFEHFKQHFNQTPLTTLPESMTQNPPPPFIQELQKISTDNPISNSCPTLTEVYNACRQCKNGKASSDIPSEFLKYARDSPEFLAELHRLISIVWKDRKVPEDWQFSDLTALWKRKSPQTDPKTWRGLSVGSSVCKLLISIILERNRIWFNKQIHDFQNGFVNDKSTTDGMFLLKRAKQIAAGLKQPLYVCFVDCTAAFDYLDRLLMFLCMRRRFPDGTDLVWLDVLESLYENTHCRYEKAGPGKQFRTTSGTRQGGPEGPPFFITLFDMCMRDFVERAKAQNIEFFTYKYRVNSHAIPPSERDPRNVPRGTRSLPWSGFADDLALFCNDLESLERATILLKEVFAEYSLKVNPTKTETMINNFKFEDQNLFPEITTTTKITKKVKITPPTPETNNPNPQITKKTKKTKNNTKNNPKTTTKPKYKTITEEVTTTTNYPKTIFKLPDNDNNVLEVKNSVTFKYLGGQDKYDDNNTGDKEIQSRINVARAKFASKRRFFTNHKIHMSTRIHVMNSEVRSVLTYGCQHWTITKDQENSLETTYNSFLRAMIRNGWARKPSIQDENTEFSLKINNKKMFGICKTDPVSDYIQKLQKDYLCHLLRRTNDQARKQMLFALDNKNNFQTVPLIQRIVKTHNIEKDKLFREAVSNI